MAAAAAAEPVRTQVHDDFKTCQQPPPLLTGAACTSAAAGQALPGAIPIPARPAAGPAAQAGCRCTAHPRQHGVAFEQLLQQAQAGAAGGHRELRQGEQGGLLGARPREDDPMARQQAAAAAAQGTAQHCGAQHCVVHVNAETLHCNAEASLGGPAAHQPASAAQRTCGYSGSTTRRVMPSRFTSSIASSAAAQGGEHSSAHALDQMQKPAQSSKRTACDPLHNLRAAIWLNAQSKPSGSSPRWELHLAAVAPSAFSSGLLAPWAHL